MFFRDPHFYRFLIDFGRPRGLQKWSLGARGAFSTKKRKVPKKRVHIFQKGAKSLEKSIRGAHFLWSWKTTCFQYHFWSVPGHHFGWFWDHLVPKSWNSAWFSSHFRFRPMLPELIKNLPRSARNPPRTSWSTIAPRHRPRIHPSSHTNKAPDRHNPKWGGGGDWPLATFNE